jgi:diacylglycerol kinase family enzyme
VDRAAPLPVIVNRSGGSAGRLGAELGPRIEQAFAAAARPIALELLESQAVGEALRRHAGAPRLVIGGGDGTIRTAAQAVAGSGGELAVLPLGTRNHFARQLGIPLDLDEAAALAATGAARPVDVGDAGGEVFVNNASAGAYVDLVHERERTRLPGVVALVYGAGAALARLRARAFALAIDGDRTTIATPLLFVGNNRYQVPDGNPTERTSLDGGELSVYALAPLSRTGLLVAALRILAGRPRMHHDFGLDRLAREVVIDGRGELAITFDGEACSMPLPLTLRIRPKALAVVQPAEASG